MGWEMLEVGDQLSGFCDISAKVGDEVVKGGGSYRKREEQR